MSEQSQMAVYGGVDTHRDTHVAAAVDRIGRVLGTAEFGADPVGYKQLHRCLGSWGRLVRVGVEGTGRLRHRTNPLPDECEYRGGRGHAPEPAVTPAKRQV